MLLLPIFPLEIIVFPKEYLNLHIFEPRYRELIADCEKDPELMIGIPFFRAGFSMQFGTLIKLLEVTNKYEDGRLDIKTEGLRPFELKRYVKTFPKKTYPGGYLIETYWEDEADPVLRTQILERINDLYGYMQIPEMPKEFAGDFISFDVGHKVGLNKAQEYQLLQIVCEPDRQKFIIDHLDRMLPMVKEAEEMRKKVQLNGHFKYLHPPSI